MRILSAWALIALLSSAVPASAEDAPDTIAPARVVTGFGALAVSEDEVFLLRQRFHLGVEFAHGSRLTIAPFVRMYATSIALHQKGGLPLDLTISLPWQPVVGARVEYRMLEIPHFQLSLRGEFESPLGENEAQLDEYIPRGKLVTAPIDINTLREHVTVHHLWRGASAAVVATGVFGALRPKVEIGYLIIDSSLVADFDATATTLLDAAGVHPDRFYNDGAGTFYYAFGLDIELGDGFALRSYGTLIPTGKKTFVAAECAFVIPIDLLSN